MSHSTVLVIGEDPEKMLEPYDENLEVEPYREYGKTEKPSEHWAFDALQEHEALASDADWPALVAAYNRRYKADDGGLQYDAEKDRVYEMSVYNPLSRWDWYQLGGRWTGFFMLKPGATGEVGEPGLMTGRAPAGRVDQARKEDIDFEAMRDAAEARAREDFAKVAAALDGCETPRSWAHVRDVMFPDDIDTARDFYHAQEALRRLRAARLDSIDCPVEYYHLEQSDPAGSFIAAARRDAGRTFAVLNADGWHEHGRMGWWGVVHDPTSGWDEIWQRLIDAAPDDALFSVYDVHI